MDQRIICKNCGNYEKLQYSSDGRYVICPKCRAQTSLYSDYTINEVKIDGFLSQDEKFYNGAKLLELRQYEQAKSVFQELTQERSADYLTWFGLARAVSHDFNVDFSLLRAGRHIIIADYSKDGNRSFSIPALDTAEYAAAGNPEGMQIVAEAKQNYIHLQQLYEDRNSANDVSYLLSEKFKHDDRIGFLGFPWFIITIPLAYKAYTFFMDYKYNHVEYHEDKIDLPLGSWGVPISFISMVAAGALAIASLVTVGGFIKAIIHGIRRRRYQRIRDQMRNQKMQTIRNIDQQCDQLMNQRDQLIIKWNQIMLTRNQRINQPDQKYTAY